MVLRFPFRSGDVHARVANDLSAYLDEELSPAERARVEAHLATCEQCRARLEELRQTVVLLRSLPPVPAPRSFAIDPGAVAPRPRVLRFSPRYYALRQTTGALAAVFVCVMALTLVLGPAQRLAPPAPPVPTEAPRPGAAAAPQSAGAPVPAATQAPAAARVPAPVPAPTSAPAAAAGPGPVSAAKAAPATAQEGASAAGAAPQAPAAAAPAQGAAAGLAATAASSGAQPQAAAVSEGAAPPGGPAVSSPSADTAVRLAPQPPSPKPTNPSSADLAARPIPATPSEAPPLLLYLTSALGLGVLASAGAWLAVWLRERR